MYEAYVWPSCLLHHCCCRSSVCRCCRVKASSLVWRVPVSEDGELSSPQRVFQLHFSRSSKMHVTGVETVTARVFCYHCIVNGGRVGCTWMMQVVRQLVQHSGGYCCANAWCVCQSSEEWGW
jgi:hypothetical protein